MLPLAFAVLLALPPSPSGVPTSPCEPALSAVGETVFVGSHGLELEIQRECLVWEWSVQPKAQFIHPPSPESVPAPLCVAFPNRKGPHGHCHFRNPRSAARNFISAG
jgi:hypothetical protein